MTDTPEFDWDSVDEKLERFIELNGKNNESGPTLIGQSCHPVDEPENTQFYPADTPVPEGQECMTLILVG